MATIETGQRLGRYHLIEPLGGGPCGEVYRAKVVGVAGMDRHFAVKRIHQWMVAEPGVSANLSAACRTYAALEHPRIARMSEFGVGNGETFTVTELVSGLDLSRLHAAVTQSGGTLPDGAALGLLSAAARAVGYAHGRGVNHLGLCPTNLLVTSDGDVRVTDFGVLACRLGPRPADDPSLAARLAYLAPEQLLGEPVSAATDVFCLGVMAYELIAGARPFWGATALELEQAILSARPEPLELPRPVARVIDRCLARSPFERFPDARALADALDAASRQTPLDGDRSDLGDKVREALEELAKAHDSQLSGAFSFAIPVAPTAPPRPRPAMAAAVLLPLPPIPSPSGSLRSGLRPMTPDPAAAPPPSIPIPMGPLPVAPTAPPSPRAPVVEEAPKVAPPIVDAPVVEAAVAAVPAVESPVVAAAVDAPVVAAPVVAPPLAPVAAPPVAQAPVVATTVVEALVAATAAAPVAATTAAAPVVAAAAPIAEAPIAEAPVADASIAEAPAAEAPIADAPAAEAPIAAAVADAPALAASVASRPAAPPRLGVTAMLPSVFSRTKPAKAASALTAAPQSVSEPPPFEAPTPPARTTPVAFPAAAPPASAEPPPTIFESLWPPTEQIPVLRADGTTAAEPALLADAPATVPGESPADEPSRLAPPRKTPRATTVPSPFESSAEPGQLPPPPPMLVQVSGPGQPAAVSGGGRRGLYVALGALALAAVAFAAVTMLRHRQAAKPAGQRAVVADAGTSMVTTGSGTVIPPARSDAGPATDAAAALAIVVDAAPLLVVDAGIAIDAAAPKPPVDAGAPKPPVDAGAPKPPIDAAAPKPPIDAAAPVIDTRPPATGDKLVLDLQPHGARVFVDGREVGRSPVTIAGTDDRRDVAAFAPGFRLYTATVDGRGQHRASLAAAPRWGGSGGIKVRCKTAKRFYVFVDGKDTGQLCPTERVGLPVGKHTVEIYDPLTRARRSFPADVVDTDHSLKVDVE